MQKVASQNNLVFKISLITAFYLSIVLGGFYFLYTVIVESKQEPKKVIRSNVIEINPKLLESNPAPEENLPGATSAAKGGEEI